MGLTDKDTLAMEAFHKAFAELDGAGVPKDLQLIAALKIASREAHMRFMPCDTFAVVAAQFYKQLVDRVPRDVMMAREKVAQDMGFKDADTAEGAVRADWRVALVEIDVHHRRRFEEMMGLKRELN